MTEIRVHKAARNIVLLRHAFPIRRYSIDLGTKPVGPKRKRGDGKTPVGSSFITHVHLKSQFTLSLGISYPNEQDLKISTALGVDPGDNIFVHGLPNGYDRVATDWTNGCIAVSNDEIREIVSLVKPGTPITIFA